MFKTIFECKQVILKHWSQMTPGSETLTYGLRWMESRSHISVFFLSNSLPQEQQKHNLRGLWCLVYISVNYIFVLSYLGSGQSLLSDYREQSATSRLAGSLQQDNHHPAVAVSDLELPHCTARTQQFIHSVTAAFILPLI